MVFCLTPVQNNNKKKLIDYVLKALKPSVKANSHSCKLFLSGICHCGKDVTDVHFGQWNKK